MPSVPPQPPEIQEFFRSNSRLFEYVYDILKNFPRIDRCPVPPIGYTSLMLSEYPYVELNCRKIYLGSTGYAEPQSAGRIGVTIPDPVNPYPYSRNLPVEYDMNMFGYTNTAITGEHLKVTMNTKTIFIGILGILYTMMVLCREGIIQNEVHARYILEYTLFNTSSTTFRGVNNYYSWVSCTNLKDVGLDYIIDLLQDKIITYQCEYYSLKNDTINILRHISGLLQ